MGSTKLIGILGLFLLLPIVFAHGDEVHSDANFGPFSLELFEDQVKEYNTQLINKTGDQGSQIRKIANALPPVILPISIGMELSDIGDTIVISIEKDLLISVRQDNQDVDLNMVLDKKELLRVMNESATATNVLSVINNSNISFEPKNFKSQLAIGILEKQMGVNIKVDETYQPTGFQKFFLNIINKILGIFIK